MSEVVIVKAQCNSCQNETNHSLVAEAKKGWLDEDWPDEIVGYDCYQIVECCGCGAIRFRRVSTNAEFCDEASDLIEDVVYFPAPVSRQKPEWLNGFQRADIVALLNEIYVAVHNELRVLAATGIRTLIEMVITEKVGDQINFGAKLSAMEDGKMISKSDKDSLWVAFDAGSASAHRGFKPSQKELNQLLDIAENLISSLHILPAKAKILSEKVPARNDKKAGR